MSIAPVVAMHGALLTALFATLLGAFVRLAPVLAADFPLNDGGLFYVFLQDIQAAHYRLPEFTSYNQASIPFLYPPLSFYLTGALSSLTGIGLLAWIRLLPPVISILTIPAVYLLARRLIKSPGAAAIAAISFALLPTAFDFMIVGGGLPRAFGFLFSILTLHQAAGLYTSGRRSYLVSTTVFACLTVLSHPVVAWFTLYSSIVLFLFLRPCRQALIHTVMVAAGTLLLTAPWWAVMIARHGLDPWLAASQAGTRSWSALLAPFLFLQTNEPYLSLNAFFALLGLFFCLRDREYLLPVWLGVVFILEPRLTATYAAIPTAFLAGVGVAHVVLAALGGGRGESDPSAEGTLRTSARGGWVAKLAGTYFLCYLLIAAYLAAPHQWLPAPQRQAMQWVRANTPTASRFVVVSGIAAAGIDYVSEWFPALTDRVSLATPQGYEWFPGQAFNRRWEEHTDLQACLEQDAHCLDRWAANAGSAYTHVYLVKQSSQGVEGGAVDLYSSLLETPGYELVYDRQEIAIFAFHPSEAAQ